MNWVMRLRHEWMKPWQPTSSRSGALLLLALAVAACAPLPRQDRPDRAPSHPPDVSGVPHPTPRDEPRSRYGNPASYEVFGKTYYVLDTAAGYLERGVASWYGEKFHGRRTSSGETYDMYAMTAAHKTLPLPTYVRVTNLRNGRDVTVKVNDRGPFVHNRVIDLSYTAASQLGIIENGTGLVEIEALSGQDDSARRAVVPLREATSTAAGQNDDKTVVFAEPVSAKPAELVEPRPTAGELFVQLGAFADPLNARALAARLETNGFDAIRITADPVQERMVYRVRIGPLTGVPELDAVAAQLASAGIADFHIAYE